MKRNAAFRIAVLPGDGIGVEVMEAALTVLDAVSTRIGIGFAWERIVAGAKAYVETGTALSDEAMAAASSADAILFGAMGMPDIRYPDGREIAPQLDIREHLELYAGVRPIKSLPGLPLPLSDKRAASIDFVLIREQTEGLFAFRGEGVVEDDSSARDTMLITRKGSERVYDFAFRLARKRREAGLPGKVTCVDKANVLRSMAFSRKIFGECAARNTDVAADYCYIDAMALNLVRQPWVYDVIVAENLFGDILSDLGAALIGGMGVAPSGDIGDTHAMFQPCHGSAPDIAGTGKANPTAMLLSAAMMLDWLAERHGVASCADGARMIETAVADAFAKDGMRPFEFGGRDGTAAITRTVLARLDKAT